MDAARRSVKIFLSHQDIYDVINIHLAALKLFGELFICRDQKTGELYVAWRSFVTFVVQIITLITLTVGGNMVPMFLRENDDDTYLHHGTSFLITISGACAIIVSISNAINGKLIWGILKCFERFDNRMMMYGAFVNHGEQKRQILQGTLIGSILVLICSSAFVSAILSDYSNRILQVATLVQIIIFVIVLISSLCQMVVVTYLATQRFRHLRCFFEINFLPWESSPLFMSEIMMGKAIHSSTNFNLFIAILDMLEDLQSAVHLINKAYSVQLILMGTSNIPSPTLALFATYRSIVTSNFDLLNIIITMSLASLIYLLSFFYLIYLSVSIRHEVNELIKAFHLLLNTNELRFHKCVQSSSVFFNSNSILTLYLGPMELNWKLAFSMVGAIVSYLIILIQFYSSGF